MNSATVYSPVPEEFKTVLDDSDEWWTRYAMKQEAQRQAEARRQAKAKADDRACLALMGIAWMFCAASITGFFL